MAQFLKKTIFAVAGSGKTTQLVNMLDGNQRFLLLTYTENNCKNLCALVENKFGHIPENISISTYFSFLFSFCIRPFIIEDRQKIQGLSFDPIPEKMKYARGLVRYISAGGYIYHSRALDLIDTYIGLSKVSERLSKFYDVVLVDEVQDFAGYDFDFIEMLGKAACHSIFVGDFFQHTFNTSNDGAKNKNLHKDYSKYRARFQAFSVVDEISLSGSYRCSSEICNFVRNNLGVNINSLCTSHNGTVTFLNEDSEIDMVMHNSHVKKLFYQCFYKYNCNGSNWGDCKGLTFDDVCVVLNSGTSKFFHQHLLCDLAPQTKNKFYVACTRPRGNLFFVEESRIKKFKMA